MTCLEFQLSTDYQNVCHLASNFFKTFFSKFPLKPGIYGFLGSASLLVLSFSCETENESAVAILVFSILINCSYF